MKRTPDLHKHTHMTAGVLSIAGCFLMVTFPDIAMKGVANGLDLFCGSVLPTMFPFFVFVNLMGRLGVPERIGRLFRPMFRRLFLCSGTGAFVWIFSLFSGYPMASKLIGEAVRESRLSTVEGKRILSFSCICGPLFMVGTVGTAMLGSSICGYLLALGHYLGALINGLIFCHFLVPFTTSDESVMREERALGKDEPIFGMVGDSIGKAFQTLGLVMGYIVLFSMLSEFLNHSEWLSPWEGRWQGSLLKGALEMTMGCDAASKAAEISGSLRLALCGFLLAFGGGSVAFQSLSLLTGSGISAGYYLAVKLCHGCFSAALTYGLTRIAEIQGVLDLPVGLVYGSDSEVVQILGGIHTTIFTAWSMVVLAGLMVCLVVLDRILHGSYQKIHKYIIERRNDNV